MSILNDPSKWQLWNSCVSALGRIGDKRAVDAVVASFRKAQAEWRKTEGMAQLERFHHWEPDMEDHIRALGNLKDARAISVIRQFCDCLKFRTLTNANYRDRIAEVIRVSLAELEGTKESPAEETKRLLDRFVGNVLDGFELQRRIAEIGEAAAPELKRRIQLDGNDSRAAMIAIQRMPPGIACPLVAEGLKCSHRAARSYAVEYMEQHRAECRESAGERAEVEPDAELAARLRLIAHDK
jgi:HEAT repeat protein